MTRILITNDDGIHSEGLTTLERALRELGDVYVVAPAAEMSGASHSLTLGRPLRIRQIDSRHWTVDGTPTDCVIMELKVVIGDKPDLVISGVNGGANLADDWLTRNLNRQLSAEASRIFEGVIDEVTVGREQGNLLRGTGAPVVGIGIPIAPRFDIFYRERIGGFDSPGATTTTSPFERDVEAEYRINRFFYVSSKLTQRRTQTGTTVSSPTAPEFNVNLKARWEY